MGVSPPAAQGANDRVGTLGDIRAIEAARWIETAPISENDRRKICYSNAATLLGLGR